MRRSLWSDRRGEVWIEYLILIALLALAGIAAVRQLGSSVGASAHEQGAALLAMTSLPLGDGSESAPVPVQSPAPAPEPEHKGCDGWLSCTWDGAKGVAGAAWDDVTGVVDLVKDPMSLIDAAKYIATHPVDAATMLVWDEETRQMWADGNIAGALGRTAYNVGSLAVPGVGEGKIASKLGKAGKLGKAEEEAAKLAEAEKAAKAERAAEDVPGDVEGPPRKKEDDEPEDDEDCVGGACEFDNCFAAGTPVHTERGLRAIEDVEVGDFVWSRDAPSGALSLQRIAQKIVHEDREVRAIVLEHEELHATPEHPFFTARGWTLAGALQPGDLVELFPDQWTQVLANDALPEHVTTYNFEVENTHTYFVGQHGAWVHNDCPPTGKWMSPRQKADRDHAAIRDRVRKEQSGFESGRHDQYPAAMRDELNRVADEAQARGNLPEYVERLREIAKTYDNRAKAAHPGRR